MLISSAVTTYLNFFRYYSFPIRRSAIQRHLTVSSAKIKTLKFHQILLGTACLQGVLCSEVSYMSIFLPVELPISLYYSFIISCSINTDFHQQALVHMFSVWGVLDPLFVCPSRRHPTRQLPHKYLSYLLHISFVVKQPWQLIRKNTFIRAFLYLSLQNHVFNKFPTTSEHKSSYWSLKRPQLYLYPKPV
jgi:hypothetical protein